MYIYDKFLLKIVSCFFEGINMFKFLFINFNKMYLFVDLKRVKWKNFYGENVFDYFFFNKFNFLLLIVVYINVIFCVEL